jgi:hypothetical protein
VVEPLDTEEGDAAHVVEPRDTEEGDATHGAPVVSA